MVDIFPKVLENDQPEKDQVLCQLKGQVLENSTIIVDTLEGEDGQVLKRQISKDQSSI